MPDTDERFLKVAKRIGRALERITSNEARLAALEGQPDVHVHPNSAAAVLLNPQPKPAADVVEHLFAQQVIAYVTNERDEARAEVERVTKWAEAERALAKQAQAEVDILTKRIDVLEGALSSVLTLEDHEEECDCAHCRAKEALR